MIESEAPPAEREASGSPIEGGVRTTFDGLGFEFPPCPAPSIGDTAGPKRADLLARLRRV